MIKAYYTAKKLFNVAFRLCYWYQVRFIYKTKQADRIFDYVKEIGIYDRRDVLVSRILKKYECTRLNISPVTKKLLCNGVLVVEIVAYLGYFRQYGKKIKISKPTSKKQKQVKTKQSIMEKYVNEAISVIMFFLYTKKTK